MLKKALSLTLVAVFLVIAGLASPAAAATMCGIQCNNENPDTFYAIIDAGGVKAVCGHDATTPTGTTQGPNPFVALGRTVQLRYSLKCRTVWARIYGGRAQDKIVMEKLGSNGEWEWYSQWEMMNPSTRNWSHMMNDAGVTVRMCFQLTWGQTYPQRLGCTGGW